MSEFTGTSFINHDVLFPGRCVLKNPWQTHEANSHTRGSGFALFELPKQSGHRSLHHGHMHHGSNLIPVKGASNLATLLVHLFLPMVTFVPYLTPPDDFRDG
jgi:hypothetical protein